MTDPYDLYLEKLDAESICLNGWCCSHPFCPDHNPLPLQMGKMRPEVLYLPVSMDDATHWDALMNDRREA